MNIENIENAEDLKNFFHNGFIWVTIIKTPHEMYILNDNIDEFLSRSKNLKGYSDALIRSAKAKKKFDKYTHSLKRRNVVGKQLRECIDKYEDEHRIVTYRIKDKTQKFEGERNRVKDIVDLVGSTILKGNIRRFIICETQGMVGTDTYRTKYTTLNYRGAKYDKVMDKQLVKVIPNFILKKIKASKNIKIDGVFNGEPVSYCNLKITLNRFSLLITLYIKDKNGWERPILKINGFYKISDSLCEEIVSEIQRKNPHDLILDLSDQYLYEYSLDMVETKKIIGEKRFLEQLTKEQQLEIDNKQQ